MVMTEGAPGVFDPLEVDVYSADESLREEYYRYLTNRQSKGHEKPLSQREQEDLLMLNAMKERRGNFRGRYPRPEEKRQFAEINAKVMNDKASEAEQEFIRQYHRWQSLEIDDFPELPEEPEAKNDLN